MKISKLICTLMLPKTTPAPGTCGSFIALILGILISSYWGVMTFMALIAICIILGIITCRHYLISQSYTSCDPKEVVIDEVVGQWIAMSLVYHNILLAGSSFIIFRILDIFKPWPINKCENLFKSSTPMASAINIMADDIVAGILSAIITLSIASFL